MAKTPTKKETKKITPGEESLKNKPHEMFCQLYAGVASKNFFGNATQSYLQALGGQLKINEFEEKKLTLNMETDLGDILKIEGQIQTIRNSARTQASTMLTNLNIKARCDYLTNRFLDPDNADREMGWVIAQREHIPSKVAAYTAIAKVKNRLSSKLEGEFIFKWEGDEDE